MNIDSIIRRRRSIRKYKLKRVPKKILRKALEAARWAPSVHNLQPWRFIIAEGEIKKRLVEIISSYRRNEPLFVRLILKEAIKIIKDAPAVILVYKRAVFSKKMKLVGGAYFNNARIWETQSVACALQNILLTLHSSGLGAAWLGIPLFRERQINRLLGVEDELMAILTIGYPNENPAPLPRKPLSEIVSFRK